MIWDSTGDGLGYLWLPVPILAVLTCTFVLFIVLPENAKLAAFLFFILIPVMLAITASTQGVDFRQLTESRAAQVNQAVERYYAQNGHYPENLQQLTPWYVLSIPDPVIIYGQDWCYQGGENYYHLGYVDREHWSAPHFIGRIYATKGKAPDLHGMCEQEAIALINRHPDYPYQYWVEGQ
jgi:hypothetical protein